MQQKNNKYFYMYTGLIFLSCFLYGMEEGKRPVKIFPNIVHNGNTSSDGMLSKSDYKIQGSLFDDNDSILDIMNLTQARACLSLLVVMQPQAKRHHKIVEKS